MYENALPDPKGFAFGEKTYQALKFVALVLLPAMTTLYFTLGNVLDLPNVEQVIGSMTAIDTFLGVLLGISTKSFNKQNPAYDGHMVIQETQAGGVLYSLELDSEPEELKNKKKVTFRVGSVLPPPEL